jgi:alpha-ribazole phosphatase
VDIYLIRHTAPSTAPGTCYGQLDVPLGDRAAAEIDATLAQLPRVNAVWSSPSQRCARLAAAIAQRDQCVLEYASALKELDFGAWEGLPWSHVPREQSDPWAEDPWNRSPPGGETEQALWQRVSDWYSQSLAQRIGPHAVVAHGGSLRMLRCLVLRLQSRQRWSWSIACGEVVRLHNPDSPADS